MPNFISQIHIEKLFNVKYLFEKAPASNGLYQYLAIIFGLFVAFSIAITYIYKKPKYPVYKRLRSNLFDLFLVCGLVGLGIIFFRFEQIPFLGSRLVLIILTLVFIIWGLIILYFKFVTMPKEINKEKEKEKFSKYLPC